VVWQPKIRAKRQEQAWFDAEADKLTENDIREKEEDESEARRVKKGKKQRKESTEENEDAE
jgi:hypothetical protein